MWISLVLLDHLTAESRGVYTLTRGNCAVHTVHCHTRDITTFAAFLMAAAVVCWGLGCRLTEGITWVAGREGGGMVWRSILVQPYRSTDGGGWKHGLAPRLRARGTPSPLFKPERDPPPRPEGPPPLVVLAKGRSSLLGNVFIIFNCESRGKVRSSQLRLKMKKKVQEKRCTRKPWS